jgi:magnesium chelatase family protein
VNAPPFSATAFGAFLVGLTARVVAVSASALPEGSNLVLEGMPEARVGKYASTDLRAAWARELRTRVRATLNALGLPSDFSIRFDPLPARSGCMDLAVLAACLGALGRLGPDVLGSTLFLGELSLDGSVRPIRGVLPMLRRVHEDRLPPGMWLPGLRVWRAVVPRHNIAEAMRSNLAFVFAVEHAADFLNDTGWPSGLLAEPSAPPWKPDAREDEVVGRGLSARTLRALEIAAAGGHGVLLVGHGESRARAARALHAFLPPMTEGEAIAATEICSVAGLFRPSAAEHFGGLIASRPFRAPHHTCSEAGLVGGGEPARPGEVSLAHGGMLFLDEIPEWKLVPLDRLAGALREGEARIWRKDERATFPARPAALVLGVAPCKCESNLKGRAMSIEQFEASHAKWCSPEDIAAYHARATRQLAPFVDMRIDVEHDETSLGVRSAFARRRVEEARRLNKTRFGSRFAGPVGRVARIADTIASLARYAGPNPPTVCTEEAEEFALPGEEWS